MAKSEICIFNTYSLQGTLISLAGLHILLVIQETERTEIKKW